MIDKIKNRFKEMRRNAKPASNDHAEQLASARKKFTPKRIGKKNAQSNKENVVNTLTDSSCSSDE